MITLDYLAGYMTEKAVWNLMEHVAANWLQEHWNVLSPCNIVVENDQFVLFVSTECCENSAFIAPESTGDAAMVWALGALAFYALMGLPVFDGNGAKNQTPLTEIPHIGSTHCSRKLSDLIYKCLAYSSEERPKMEEILNIARVAVEDQVLPIKRLANKIGKTYTSSLVSFWPEEMICILLFLLTLLISSPVEAQNPVRVTSEMEILVRRCKDLRTPGNVEKVSRELLYDMDWTLMDEIDIDRQGECTDVDLVDMFGINDIGYRIVRRQGGVVNTGGRFRNGQDSRYSYSFIEITVKKGSTVSYEITGRQGLQCFAIVPYEENASFSAKVTKEGKHFSSSIQKDGVCYIQLDEKVGRSDLLNLTVRNGSGKNMAFVIINHNPGK